MTTAAIVASPARSGEKVIPCEAAVSFTVRVNLPPSFTKSMEDRNRCPGPTGKIFPRATRSASTCAAARMPSFPIVTSADESTPSIEAVIFIGSAPPPVSTARSAFGQSHSPRAAPRWSTSSTFTPRTATATSMRDGSPFFPSFGSAPASAAGFSFMPSRAGIE